MSLLENILFIGFMVQSRAEMVKHCRQTLKGIDKEKGTLENKRVAIKSARKKILIVEDEELLLEMYREVFEKEGFGVATATSGQEAVHVAKQEKPDFILLDILLPGNNGIYFLEQKKADPELAPIPVLAFSNFDDPQIKKSAFRLGAKDYLLKTDYTPNEVLDKVKKYVK